MDDDSANMIWYVYDPKGGTSPLGIAQIRFPGGLVLTGEAVNEYMRDKSRWGKPPSEWGKNEGTAGES